MLTHLANPIPREIQAALMLVDLIIKDKIGAAAIAGPPGIGKSHLVITALKAAGVPWMICSGTPAGILFAAYELRAGGVLVFDDADGPFIGGGTDVLNFMKALTNSGPVRTLGSLTSAALKGKALTPARFDTKARVIRISNMDATDLNAVKPANRPHYAALLSRMQCQSISHARHWCLDYILHLVCTQNLIQAWQPRISLRAAQDVLDFVCHNAWTLREVSLRVVQQITDLRAALEFETWLVSVERFKLPTPVINAAPPLAPLLAGQREQKAPGFCWRPSVVVPPTSPQPTLAPEGAARSPNSSIIRSPSDQAMGFLIH